MDWIDEALAVGDGGGGGGGEEPTGEEIAAKLREEVGDADVVFALCFRKIFIFYVCITYV